MPARVTALASGWLCRTKPGVIGLVGAVGAGSARPEGVASRSGALSSASGCRS
jgi:hypothetical protein